MNTGGYNTGRYKTLAVALLAGLTVAVLVAMVAGDSYASTLKHRRAVYSRMILHTFGHTQLGYQMICVANRETGGRWNPHAWNHTDHHTDGSVGSFGLFQIGALWRDQGETVAHFRRRMFNPRQNIAMARWLFIHSGLQPWGNHC